MMLVLRIFLTGSITVGAAAVVGALFLEPGDLKSLPGFIANGQQAVGGALILAAALVGDLVAMSFPVNPPWWRLQPYQRELVVRMAARACSPKSPGNRLATLAAREREIALRVCQHGRRQASPGGATLPCAWPSCPEGFRGPRFVTPRPASTSWLGGPRFVTAATTIEVDEWRRVELGAPGIRPEFFWALVSSRSRTHATQRNEPGSPTAGGTHMAKFEVGQKVKVINVGGGLSYRNLKVGDIVTVTRDEGDSCVQINGEGAYFDTRFEALSARYLYQSVADGDVGDEIDDFENGEEVEVYAHVRTGKVEKPKATVE